MKPSPVPAILLFVASAILLYCAFGTTWFTDGDFGVGLARVKNCSGMWDASGTCHSEWFLSAKRVHLPEILATGTLVFTIATIGMSLAAGLTLLRPGKSMFAMLAVIPAGLAIVLGLAFTAKVHEHGATFGAGFYLFWLATLGVIACGAVGMMRPAAGAPMPQPAPLHGVQMGGPLASAPIGAPCPTCLMPTMFVAHLGKSFCQRCNRYLV